MKKITAIFLFLNLVTLPFSHAALPKVEKGKALPSDIFVELNKVINPAVVNISTETKPKIRQNSPWGGGPSSDPMEELLRQFFGGGLGGQSIQPRSSFSLGK